MITPEQLKGRIRYISKEKGLSSQEVLQMYLFERVMDRLSNSDYRENFIIKGGYLISSMIGIDERTTMDVDTTVTGVNMSEDEIVRIIKEVLAIDVNDGITFTFDRVEPIMEDADYANFRIYFHAKYGKINNPMKMDISTGDEITPAAVEHGFKSILDDSVISMRSYNLETIIAEKFETIIRRNIGNTRARDIYDLYALTKLYGESVNYEILKEAITRTSRKRGSFEEINDWENIYDEIVAEEALINLWDNYRSEYRYASDIPYDEAISAVKYVAEKVI
ncbi:MAG: nucleotidyl transferase AbiEii/AbiGii toxin family protein [Lachnospiraceae bacterium]|nr:nucleotidyl transferase AbiEii/AbiGii toxin family protein [Lachnospiraceae bacterium]